MNLKIISFKIFSWRKIPSYIILKNSYIKFLNWMKYFWSIFLKIFLREFHSQLFSCLNFYWNNFEQQNFLKNFHRLFFQTWNQNIFHCFNFHNFKNMFIFIFSFSCFWRLRFLENVQFSNPYFGQISKNDFGFKKFCCWLLLVFTNLHGITLPTIF